MSAQCMGGWCQRRDACEHYHAPERPGRPPAERLCERGHDEPALMHDERRAERERLAADPRFAQWGAAQ